MSKLGVGLLIMFLIGIVVFAGFILKLGEEAILQIIQNINISYFVLFLVASAFGHYISALRWKVILKAYGKKVSSLTLFRQMLAGYAVSYVTPCIRLGGEPLRAYMLKKEKNIDLKTGTASIILDKFIEVAGIMLFGLIGLIFFVFVPKINFSMKVPFLIFTLAAFFILFIFYHRTVTGKGSFSSLFDIFKLYKIARLKNLLTALEDVEKKLSVFFKKHKKAFVLSFLLHTFYVLWLVVETKLLLLSFGANGSLTVIVLALTVLGIVSFIPVPAGLGFLEAGQTGVFVLLKGSGSMGLALSLMMRIGAAFFIVIGFIIILFFGAGQAKKFASKFLFGK